MNYFGGEIIQRNEMIKYEWVLVLENWNEIFHGFEVQIWTY